MKRNGDSSVRISSNLNFHYGTSHFQMQKHPPRKKLVKTKSQKCENFTQTNKQNMNFNETLNKPKKLFREKFFIKTFTSAHRFYWNSDAAPHCWRLPFQRWKKCDVKTMRIMSGIFGEFHLAWSLLMPVSCNWVLFVTFNSIFRSLIHFEHQTKWIPCQNIFMTNGDN